MSRRRQLVASIFGGVLAAGGWLLLRDRDAPLPAGLTGLVVYVSDREGQDAVYSRRLPTSAPRRVTPALDPARDPALSPDGSRVAFASLGRIGIAPVVPGDATYVTLGVDWRDAAPAWEPSAKALVVVSRRREGENGDLHLLTFKETGVERHPLTQTPGLDESSPAFGADGKFVVFVREDSLFRLDLADGRSRRLTSGLRRSRRPRVLRSGRVLHLWSEEKRFGIDIIDPSGKTREALAHGTAYYEDVVPSPDGQYLLATFVYDLRFRPRDLLRLKRTSELRVLDQRGNPVGTLEASSRASFRAPDWGR